MMMLHFMTVTTVHKWSVVAIISQPIHIVLLDQRLHWNELSQKSRTNCNSSAVRGAIWSFFTCAASFKQNNFCVSWEELPVCGVDWIGLSKVWCLCGRESQKLVTSVVPCSYSQLVREMASSSLLHFVFAVKLMSPTDRLFRSHPHCHQLIHADHVLHWTQRWRH